MHEALVVRFAGDYGALFPLWTSRGQLTEDPMELRHLLGIEDDLVTELRRWQERWESRRSMGDLENLYRDGQMLVDRLRESATEGMQFVFAMRRPARSARPSGDRPDDYPHG